VTPDEHLAALKERYGERWEIWVVHNAVGPPTWCANPWSKKDDRRNVLHADRPEHLAEYIAEYRADDDGDVGTTP
jgi:hypothetical protein